MDALALLIAALTAVAGLAVGWLLGRNRGAADLARSDAELSVVREDRDRQHDLYRDAVEHARREQHDAAERVRQENAVLTALAPVRESLHRMQQTVTVLERERQTQFGQLSEQLRRSEENGEALRSTTESLAGALRSTSARGVWGETQLRRVVEAAGLTRHVDFDLQATIHSDAGHGRPDMVIRLAGGASIAVDAKAPLDAFLAAGALSSEDPQRRSLMQQHVKAVRAHVDALAKKAYWSGLDVSPEFVICFLPSESLLSAALDEDPTLLDYAFGKRVALATPVNLWAVLKTVAYTWKQQELSAEAAVLLDLGTQLYDRLGVLAGHADDLRRALERTVDSYNRFAGSLESRVLVTARRFPGVDADALTAPPTLTSATRRFTADELVSSADEDQAEGIRADLGELRGRLSEDADAALIDQDAGRPGHDDRREAEDEVRRSREQR
ncbi:DNA recombination protein RmuC [Microbacterium sp. Au-Mic1]|uniref:DNA recombination protein RmuC n=1 Tax=Microbacterium sp. Au-Mic1 TaxID=2906457 RepID=UPI001E3FE72B|nr:DNA recombination protein RmuC [Microbacterium sp. Au-Mic1]MCE4027122.1 DNA recombination protein RmuC [Microbacterium sp. Au-Mic1]